MFSACMSSWKPAGACTHMRQLDWGSSFIYDESTHGPAMEDGCLQPDGAFVSGTICEITRGCLLERMQDVEQVLISSFSVRDCWWRGRVIERVDLSQNDAFKAIIRANSELHFRLQLETFIASSIEFMSSVLLRRAYTRVPSSAILFFDGDRRLCCTSRRQVVSLPTS